MVVREFVCEDCGGDIVYFVGIDIANDNPVCLTCAFIRTLAPEHREEAKRRLGVTERGNDHA